MLARFPKLTDCRTFRMAPSDHESGAARLLAESRRRNCVVDFWNRANKKRSKALAERLAERRKSDYHQTMLEYIAWVELILCWIAWALAFLKPSRQSAGRKTTERASSSRLGIAFVFVAFFLDWVYFRPVGYHQPKAESIASMILGPCFVVLAWAAAHTLGEAVALRGRAKRGPRADPDRRLQLAPPSHLRRHAGHVCHYRARVVMVAQVPSRPGLLPHRNRDPR